MAINIPATTCWSPQFQYTGRTTGTQPVYCLLTSYTVSWHLLVNITNWSIKQHFTQNAQDKSKLGWTTGTQPVYCQFQSIHNIVICTPWNINPGWTHQTYTWWTGDTPFPPNNPLGAHHHFRAKSHGKFSHWRHHYFRAKYIHWARTIIFAPKPTWADSVPSDDTISPKFTRKTSRQVKTHRRTIVIKTLQSDNK